MRRGDVPASIFAAIMALVLLGIVLDRVLRWFVAWWRSFWGGVVEIATAVLTTVGVVICVLGALAALVITVYVIGTFVERMHRQHLYSRHRREQLAMEWDMKLIKQYPEGPEDFDG
jgi:hypothetical protein